MLPIRGKLLIDIILSDECSCCKIYYKAVHEDPSIGIATVYRMVKTLEDIGAIDRKNQYRISCGENCEFRDSCVLVLKNKGKGDAVHGGFQGGGK